MQLGSRELMMFYIDLKRTNDVLLTFEALKVNYSHGAKKLCVELWCIEPASCSAGSRASEVNALLLQ